MKIDKFWPREVWNEGTQVLGRVGSGKEKKKACALLNSAGSNEFLKLMIEYRDN